MGTGVGVICPYRPALNLSKPDSWIDIDADFIVLVKIVDGFVGFRKSERLQIWSFGVWRAGLNKNIHANSFR